MVSLCIHDPIIRTIPRFTSRSFRVQLGIISELGIISGPVQFLCHQRELAWTVSLSFLWDFFHYQMWRSSSWMSLPKTYLLAHSKGCRTFLTESGACFSCTARVFTLSTIKTAGKRGECIRFKFLAVLFTNFNNKCASRLLSSVGGISCQ